MISDTPREIEFIRNDDQEKNQPIMMISEGKTIASTNNTNATTLHSQKNNEDQEWPNWLKTYALFLLFKPD